MLNYQIPIMNTCKIIFLIAEVRNFILRLITPSWCKIWPQILISCKHVCFIICVAHWWIKQTGKTSCPPRRKIFEKTMHKLNRVIFMFSNISLDGKKIVPKQTRKVERRKVVKSAKNMSRWKKSCWKRSRFAEFVWNSVKLQRVALTE